MVKVLLLLFLSLSSLYGMQNTSDTAFVYYTPGSHNPNETLETIKKSGIQSYNNQIYFSPERRPSDTVAYRVNPKTTNVFNSQYRHASKLLEYKWTKIGLAQYLAYKHQAMEMTQANPGKLVIFNSISCEPCLVGPTDVRIKLQQSKFLTPDYHEHLHVDYTFIGEVNIERDCIKSKELIFLDEQNFIKLES